MLDKVVDTSADQERDILWRVAPEGCDPTPSPLANPLREQYEATNFSKFAQARILFILRAGWILRVGCEMDADCGLPDPLLRNILLNQCHLWHSLALLHAGGGLSFMRRPARPSLLQRPSLPLSRLRRPCKGDAGIALGA